MNPRAADPVFRITEYAAVQKISLCGKDNHPRKTLGLMRILCWKNLLMLQIVKQCPEVGLVRGDNLSVDGSFVEANAAKESRIPREQLAEAAQVKHTLRQYLSELEEQNPVEEPVHEQDQVSTTDPDSTYATKGVPGFVKLLLPPRQSREVSLRTTPLR
jgi:hypothetical protein